MSSLSSNPFSGLSSGNNILQNLGFGGGSGQPTEIVDPSSCMIALESAQQQIQKQNSSIKEQKRDIEYLKRTFPSLNSQLTDIQKEIDQQNLAKSTSVTSTNVPTLYIALALLVLLFAIGIIYNQLVTKNIINVLEETGVLDSLAKAFKKGDFMIDVDNDSKPFSEYWTFVLNNIIRVITRGRFVALIVLFLFLLSINLFIYSIVYRGQDIGNATKIISIILSIVLMLTFIIVNNQTMNNPFENVIGYQMIRGANLTDLITHIFKHKYFESKNTFPGANLYYDFIINTMSVKNYPTVLEDIYKNADSYDFKINVDEDGINKTRVTDLYTLIITKNSVGHMCWMYFGSLVGTIISLKYLFAAGMV